MRISRLWILSLLTVNAVAADLTVRLDEAPATGVVVIQVYDSQNAFGDFRDPLREASFDLASGGEYRIDGLPGGTVAVLAYIDENGNGVLDKNFIGIPREPIALSNGYRPKGPPSFQRAAILLEARDDRTVVLELYRALGDRGRWGVGAGVIAQSSPYAGSNGTVTQAIPAITYNGQRLQWLGPVVQYGLAGSGRLRLAASATYRIAAYDEADSPRLSGLGDRDSTLLAGLGLRYEVPGGFNLLLRYEHDVLNRIGGGQGKVRVTKGFQAGIFRLVPQLSLNWLAADLANHDFGVAVPSATAERPAYDVGSAVSLEAGFGSFIELSENWRVLLNLSIEQFGDNVADSPIMDTGRVARGFAAITYVF